MENAWERGEMTTYLSTWSHMNVELAMKWHHSCWSSHDTCRTLVEKPLLPKRVIDVGEPAGDHQPVLIQPPQPTVAEYMTLSHCWGDGTPLEPVCEIEPGRMWTLPPLSTWDKTFQDAVTVVKTFGMRYLWIDAPCILQGPANRLDWETESVKMARYFQNATLCICATHARSGRDGLFQSRNPIMTYPYCLSLRAGSSTPECERYICVGSNRVGMEDEIYGPRSASSPLHSRAWCLQEELLSPRMLRFGQTRIYWQCLSDVHSESCTPGAEHIPAGIDHAENGTSKICIHVEIPRREAESAQLRNSYHDAWDHILTRFNQRDISYQNDILPAISGLAEAFSPYLVHDEYVVGLWRRDIFESLLWSVANIGPERRKVGSSQSNFDPSFLNAPSWSWISAGHKNLVFSIYKRPERRTSNLSSLLATEVSLRNKGSPFGVIEGATLKFWAQCPAVTVMPGTRLELSFHDDNMWFTVPLRDFHHGHDHRMEMDSEQWNLLSQPWTWPQVSKYGLLGQCDLDDYGISKNSAEEGERMGTNSSDEPNSTIPARTDIIKAFFLPLKSDRAEFGKARSMGLIIVKATAPEHYSHGNCEFYRRIGCGKLDIGTAAWKACKVVAKEICLI